MRLMIPLLFLMAAAAAAQDEKPETRPSTLPDPHFHEFNMQTPTEFKGQSVDLKTAADTPFKLYVSGDVKASRQILLIHEWWGLNAHIKGLADQFAGLGYRAYAVDLYDGKSATDPEQAGKLMQAANADRESIAAKLKAAIAHAGSENAPAKLATIGWCFGGGLSLRAAIAGGADVNACVIYYGELEQDAAKLEPLKAPILGIFAKKDTWITPDMVDGFKAAMAKANKQLEIEMYDADHAFANPSQTRFQEKAARDAWAKTLAFLDKHLK